MKSPAAVAVVLKVVVIVGPGREGSEIAGLVEMLRADLALAAEIVAPGLAVLVRKEIAPHSANAARADFAAVIAAAEETVDFGVTIARTAQPRPRFRLSKSHLFPRKKALNRSRVRSN